MPRYTLSLAGELVRGVEAALGLVNTCVGADLNFEAAGACGRGGGRGLRLQGCHALSRHRAKRCGLCFEARWRHPALNRCDGLFRRSRTRTLRRQNRFRQTCGDEFNGRCRRLCRCRFLDRCNRRHGSGRRKLRHYLRRNLRIWRRFGGRLRRHDVTCTKHGHLSAITLWA